VLLHAAHLRAQVNGCEMHSDAMRLQHALEQIDDLVPHPLLHREAPAKEPHHPRQLGDADDVVVRDVAHVGVPEERQRVVLAERMEGNRPFDDLARLAIRTTRALGGKGGDQLLVALVAGGGVEHRAQETLGRARGAGSGGRHAQRGEDLAHVALEARPILGGDAPRPRLHPGHLLFFVAMIVHRLLQAKA
jgi:hypothetical protein